MLNDPKYLLKIKFITRLQQLILKNNGYFKNIVLCNFNTLMSRVKKI